MPIGGIDEVSALIRQQTIREVERLFQFDDLRFVFLALEDAEDVSPEEGGGCDEDDPHGCRHDKEVDVLHRNPEHSAGLKFIKRIDHS